MTSAFIIQSIFIFIQNQYYRWHLKEPLQNPGYQDDHKTYVNEIYCIKLIISQ